MKKTLKALLIIVIVVALVIGSVAGVTYYQNGKNTVDVYSVSMLNLGYYEDTTTSEGVVKNNASQSVYVTDGQKVVDVFVTEGQEVAEGDPLMEYDVTSLELSVQMKKLQIEGLQNEYDTAVAKLTKLKNTTPIPDTQASPSELPNQETSESVSQISVDITSVDQKTGGQGTTEDPYVFKCDTGSRLSGAVINGFKTNSAVARFDAVDASGNVAMSVTMNGAYISKTYEDSDMVYIFSGNHDNNSDADNTEKPDGTDDSEIPDDSEMPDDSNGIEDGNVTGYTAKELAQETAKQEREVRKIDIRKRTAENELTNLEEQLADGVVRSKVNGVVKTVHDIDDIPTDGSAFMVVSGSEGLYIEGSVSELMLDKIKIGQSVTAYDWESGNNYQGQISEIDVVPTNNNSYYGEGNPNVSYYGYTAYIEDPSGLMAGQYLQLTIENSDNSNQDKLYIQQCYVREENGRSYVYKDNDGRLEKQYVQTGSILWGSYVEIKSGITVDDYIAFPYGKNVKDGAATVVSEDMY